MAEITRERSGQIVREALTVLLDQPGGLGAGEVISLVADRLGVTAYEAASSPSTPGNRRFDKILRFATIPATKGGWLVKSKGIWTVTGEGRTALSQFPEPAEF